jgi:hypothetical protein
MPVLDEKISAIVGEQLPEFVKSDYPTFVSFLEAYYEFVEQEGGAIEATRNARLYNDIDRTVDDFVEHFRKEYMIDIPDTMVADKRQVAKYIKEFYEAKGTTKSIELLFRLLFNEQAEIYYPKRDMLRVSDGKYNINEVVHLINVTGEIGNIVGLQIKQESNLPIQIEEATATIESVISFYVGTTLVNQCVITPGSIEGDFIAGQEVFAIDSDGNEIRGTLDHIITGVQIQDGGAYYSEQDGLEVYGGTGDDAQFAVISTGRGGIDRIQVLEGGSGYYVGEPLEITSPTIGSGFSARVARTENACLLENGSDFIVFEDGGKILEEVNFITLESGDSILLEEGSLDPNDPHSHYILDENNGVIGEIKEIEILNSGQNFPELPTVDVVDYSEGTGAIFRVQSDNIGSIQEVERISLGTGYTEPPRIVGRANLQCYEIEGTFTLGETVTEEKPELLLENGEYLLLEDGGQLLQDGVTPVSGTLLSVDYDTGLIRIEPDTEDDVFDAPHHLVGQVSGAKAEVLDAQRPIIIATSGAVATTLGKFVNADGRISEASKKIQDSFFYQDFSYVIKVGQSINVWRDAIKRILHPVGLALFGEVSVQTSVRAQVYGGSNFRLNNTQPRFKQIQQLIQTTVDATIAGKRELLVELEILGLANNVLLAGISQTPDLIPTLILPRSFEPLTNIDGRISLVKQWTMRLGNVAFDGAVKPKVQDTGDASVVKFYATLVAALKDLVPPYGTTHQQYVLEIHSEAQALCQRILNIVIKREPIHIIEGALAEVRESLAVLKLDDIQLTDYSYAKALGPTYHSLERYKFLFAPYTDSGLVSISEGGEVYRDAWSQDYTSVGTSSDYNAGYWDTYSNTQIKHLSHINLDDLVNNTGKKTNIAFDTYIELSN